MTPPTAAELKKIARDRQDQYVVHTLETILGALDSALRAAAHDGRFMVRVGAVRSDCAERIHEGLNEALSPRGFAVILQNEDEDDGRDAEERSVCNIETSAVYVDWAGDPSA
jgi:hypothetical protein